MNNQEVKNSIAEKVLNKIKSGQVKMKPRAYFVLQMIFLTLGALFLGLFIIYIISFIIFSLRVSGIWFLPGFGFPGIKILFSSLPWFLILIAAILIILLETIAKRFTVVYRKPIIYSLIVIILIVVLGSFIINKTQFHPTLFQRAQEGRLPVAGEFYRDFGMPRFQNVHRGVVSEVIDNGFYIETANGQILHIVVTSETRFPFGTGIQEGDTVVVLGEQSDDIIQAFGVSKVNDDFNLFRQNRPSKPRNILMPHRMPIIPGR